MNNFSKRKFKSDFLRNENIIDNEERLFTQLTTQVNSYRKSQLNSSRLNSARGLLPKSQINKSPH